MGVGFAGAFAGFLRWVFNMPCLAIGWFSGSGRALGAASHHPQPRHESIRGCHRGSHAPPVHGQ